MLLEFSFVLIFTLLVGLIFARFKIPSVAAYLVSGILLGVFFRAFIKNQGVFSSISDFGIVFLMFAIGVEFSAKKMFSFKSPIFKMVFAQVFLTTIAIFLVLLFIFKFSFNYAILVSLLFSFSSTVIVAKLLTENGIVHTVEGETSLLILIFQDLFVLPISIFLPLLMKYHTFSFDVVLNFALIFVKSGVIFALLFFVSRRVVPWVFEKVAKVGSHDLFLVTSVAFAILISSISERLGFSLAIGAFIAGVLVSLTMEKQAVFSEIKSLRDIFSIIFFVFLGFAINPVFIFSNFLMIFGAAIIVILIKIIILYFISILFEFHKKNSAKIAINLASISEFAFILSAMYFKQKLIDQFHFEFIVSVALLTIIISPFLFKSRRKIITKLKFLTEEKNKYAISPSLNLENHVVICGFGRIGQRVISHLKLNDVPFIVVDDNKRDIEKLKGFGELSIYGDATQIEILNYTSIQKARVLVVAIPDRFSQELIIRNAKRLNPKIIIFARAHENDDKKYLYAMGADYVLYPEFEGAMTLSKKILDMFGVSDLLINQSLKKIEEDEKII